MKKYLLSLIFVCLSATACAKDDSPLLVSLQKLAPEFRKIRQQLHEIPERRYEEVKTSQFVKEQLERFGYEVKTGFAGTGLTAVLDSGQPGKTVAIRADMDGLPMTEKNKIGHASKHEGFMHACGHDGHMATVLMVAKALSNQKNLFKGKIKFIFQPAEEGGAGALKMIKDGALEKPRVDAIFGYHNWPLPKDVVAVRKGAIMASSDHLEIHIEGKGGHGAMPHLTKNPILAGTQIITASQSLIHQHDPLDSVVLNFCAFDSGTTTNVVPDKAVLKGTLRTLSTKTRDEIVKKLQNLTTHICSSQDVKASIKYLGTGYPPTTNHDEMVDVVLTAAKDIKDEKDILILKNPVMPAEDFSFYLLKIPGCFFFVGSGENNQLHTSTYDFKDDIMPTAAYTLAKSAIDYLNKN